MSNVYEFIKETKHDGEVKWYTTKNGSYVNSSLSFKEDEARTLFELIKERGDLEPIKEVIDIYNK